MKTKVYLTCVFVVLLLAALPLGNTIWGQEKPVWKFTGITQQSKWVNADFDTAARHDTRGGEALLAIRGTGIHCPRNGVEKVRFRWSFNRDVSVLRPGEDIETTLHVEAFSRDNFCTGQLDNWSFTEAVTSNSSRYTNAEAGLYEDRIKFKKGDSARGGDRTPSLRNAATVLTVYAGPNTTKNKIRFSIRVSGPCDDPAPWSCGYFEFQYNYELDRKGGGEDAKACGYFLGSGIYGKWIQTGGERGFLGCARSGEAEAGRSWSGTTGRYALFKGWADAGVIIWHRNGINGGRSFEVHGAIGQLYQRLGGTNSWLGFPVSDEYSVPGGRRSDFEGGFIFWDEKTGKVTASRSNFEGANRGE